MALKWFGASKPETVGELISRKKYKRASEMLREELSARPGSPRIRQQLADVLVAAGKPEEAVPLLLGLADDLALEGKASRCIAILKRIETIQPGRSDVSERLAYMLKEKDRKAREAAAAASRARADGAGAAAGAPGAELGEIDLGRELELDMGELLGGEAPAQEELARVQAAAAEERSFFEGFGEEELLALMQGLRLSVHEPGDIVVTEGEPGDSLFVITGGRVKAWVKDGTGKSRLVREMGEGEFFGEIALLEGKPRTATVTAATGSELLELDRRSLDAIVQAHPHVLELLEEFARRRSGSSIEAEIRSTGA